MFIYLDNLMYQVSLETVQEKIKRTLVEKLSPLFKEKLLEDVVKEVMDNTTFNPVYENSVLVSTKDGLRTLVFGKDGIHLSGKICKFEDLYPSYSGPICKEVESCMDYTFERLYDKDGIEKPKFVQIGNSFELTSMCDSIHERIKSILEEYFSKEISSAISKKVCKDVPLDNIFVVCLKNGNKTIIQSVNNKFEVKKQDISAEKIKNTIVDAMPKFKAVSVVAEEVANRLYNLIVYNWDEGSREFCSPIGYIDGKFVFGMQEHGVNFFYDYNSCRWISEYIMVQISQLTWEKTEDLSEKAYYEGLQVICSNQKEYNKQTLEEDIPIISGLRIRDEKINLYKYFKQFSRYNKILYGEYDEDFKVYVRLEL